MPRIIFGSPEETAALEQLERELEGLPPEVREWCIRQYQAGHDVAMRRASFFTAAAHLDPGYMENLKRLGLL